VVRWIGNNKSVFMNEKIKQILVIFQSLTYYFSSAIIKTDLFILNIRVSDQVFQILKFLRDSTFIQAKTLLDLTVVDYPEYKKRFELSYILVSIRYNLRLLVRTSLGLTQSVPSVANLFSSALWLEREVWDMFGVPFSNHKDLRRILTDYGFRGFPLRKDFPLSGYVEVRFDEERKTVVTEPIEITQEFRLFEFNNPWEQKN
jgi:NADH/F420H2 dehydrogenase subunit C